MHKPSLSVIDVIPPWIGLLYDSPTFIFRTNQPSCPSKFSLPWHTALYSSTGHNSEAKNHIKNAANNTPRKASPHLSARFPHRPHHQKAHFRPSTPTTLSSTCNRCMRAGWGRSPILPNGNGIAVLRKRVEFANAEALEGFLVEEKKQSVCRMCLRINMPSSSAWTHVARRRSDAKVDDKDKKTHGVSARDIRLANALEELYESALAAGGIVALKQSAHIACWYDIETHIPTTVSSL
ncbi:hypothetical protein F5888DRAFT_606090 [Russula emetica]|nr:hypothetical protein F5888DRAFT_606090 [Russula emetica]